jgi:hypothetical protein
MRLRTLFLAMAAFVFAAPVWAHHNMSAIYDFQRQDHHDRNSQQNGLANPHIEIDRRRQRTAALSCKAGRSKDRRPVFSALAKSTRRMLKPPLEKPSLPKPAVPETVLAPACCGPMTLPDGKVISACPQNC